MQILVLPSWTVLEIPWKLSVHTTEHGHTVESTKIVGKFRLSTYLIEKLTTVRFISGHPLQTAIENYANYGK